MAENKNDVYWEKTSRLMMIMMGLWIFFSFIIHMFVFQLNAIKIAGYPLGFYMASQGSLIIFNVMLFWFAKAQHDIDVACNVAEDE